MKIMQLSKSIVNYPAYYSILLDFYERIPRKVCMTLQYIGCILYLDMFQLQFYLAHHLAYPNTSQF